MTHPFSTIQMSLISSRILHKLAQIRILISNFYSNCGEGFEPRPGGCGLFRAATISPVPSIGAENSKGYGGSPCRGGLYAHPREGINPSPTPFVDLGTLIKSKGAVGGMSPLPVADSPETTPPWLRLKKSLFAAKGLHWSLSL